MTSTAAQQLSTASHAVGADEERMRRDAEADALVTPALQLRLFDSIEAAAGPWRALEATAVLTPYQRYDWVRALVESRGLDGRCVVAVVSAGDTPVGLFPLEVRNRFGARIATLIGADIGNADWLVLDPSLAERLAPDVLLGLFREIGGIDVLRLTHQPANWLGLTNPLLAFPHQTAPDHLYYAPVGGARSALLSSKRIRNIQRGRRRLEEQMGAVTLRRAETAEDIARIHEVFLAQRGARFVDMGIQNIFAEDWFVRFFRRAAELSLGSPRPAMRFHALYAGDEIVATSCGAYAQSHYSQFINSTAAGPAAKYSLMGILMYDLMAELTADGITSIDLGLGDFDYKTDWTEKTEVFDSAIPLTARGRLAAPALLSLRRLKRAIKQNQALFGSFKWLRAMLNS